ncbi:hypothetical protein Tco_1405685 [Tanacetum coccineum]
METKDTSSCTDSEEMKMQRLQKKESILKSSCISSLRALKSKQTYFSKKYVPCVTESNFNMHLAISLVKTLTHSQERSLKTWIHWNNNLPKKQFMSLTTYMIESILHNKEIEQRMNAKKLQIQECKVQDIKALDASPIFTESGGIDSGKKNESCRSGNDMNNSGNEKNSSGNESSNYGKESNNLGNVPYTAEYNVFVVATQHTEQPENMNDTSLMEKVDNNTTPNSSDMCNNEFKDDHNADDHEDERVMLANLIANLKLVTNENKKIQKQLRKANTTLTHGLNECKYSIEESNGIRDRCRIALHQN